MPPGAAIAIAPGVDPAVARAIAAARERVLADPQSAAAWGTLGLLLAVHSYPAEATVALTRATALDVHEPRWPYYLGSELCYPAPPAAAAALRQAAEREDLTHSVLAHQRLAEALIEAGDLDSANAEVVRVLAQRPDDPRARLALARLSLSRNDAPAALSHLERCKNDPHAHRAALLLIGQAKQRLQDIPAAEIAIAQALKLGPDPDWPDPWREQADALKTGRAARINRTAALLNLNQLAAAGEEAAQLVVDYPDFVPAWILLGRARTLLGDYASALQALSTAATLEPNSADAHFYRATALLYDKKFQTAADEYRRTLTLQNDFAEAHHNLGHCLLGIGDQNGAIAEFREAIRCKPNLAEAHLDLGRQLSSGGFKEDAIVEFRKAAALAPGDARPRTALESLGASTTAN